MIYTVLFNPLLVYLFKGPFYKDLKEQYQKYYGEKDQKGKYTKTFIVNYLIVNVLLTKIFEITFYFYDILPYVANIAVNNNNQQEDKISSDVYSSISNTTQAIQKLDKLNITVDLFLKKNPTSISIKDSKEREQL